jgi:chaperonin GroEL
MKEHIMSLFQVGKPKSAAKVMIPSSTKLQDEVVKTLSHIAEMVGATLGPGGRQVLIERSEVNMKPIITKDGVTVVKNLGYEEATKQLILEAARDAAIRTANEAGDGTTTATILSSAIAEYTSDATKNNPRLSPQKIVREMEKLVPVMEEIVEKYKLKINGDNYKEVLHKVASLSGNGDLELSDAIIEGLELVGEEGNMTIVEMQGPSKYIVERINGYTVERGYEESCRNFSNGFINNKSGNGVELNNPIVILFDGNINDMSQVFEAFTKLSEYFDETNRQDKNIVLVAHGFSEIVLGDLHVNWNHPHSKVKILPLMTPEKAIQNWRTNFLYDLQAYTGTPVFNPIDRPIVDINPQFVCNNSRVKKIDVSRYKTMVFADEDPEAISIRVEELKLQKEKPESIYELNDLEVRIGKLTAGIVRLNISGPSSGETREKRDRAEDAWMAIKGALKHGAVPGGGYILTRIAAELTVRAEKITDNWPKKLAALILGESLLHPVKALYRNYGYVPEEILTQIYNILKDDSLTYDLSAEKWVPAYDLLDSAPAVLEAIRNSISIASLLGTLGGIVAFKRDNDSDKQEEKFVRQFEAATGQRGSVENE